jgi:hypothetical protein
MAPLKVFQITGNKAVHVFPDKVSIEDSCKNTSIDLSVDQFDYLCEFVDVYETTTESTSIGDNVFVYKKDFTPAGENHPITLFHIRQFTEDGKATKKGCAMMAGSWRKLLKNVENLRNVLKLHSLDSMSDPERMMAYIVSNLVANKITELAKLRVSARQTVTKRSRLVPE